MPKRILGFTVLLLLMAEIPASAYVDPGAGILLWQVLLGALVGSSFYMRRLFSALKRK